jgi:citronellyl-CoA dehydrogenase
MARRLYRRARASPRFPPRSSYGAPRRLDERVKHVNEYSSNPRSIPFVDEWEKAETFPAHEVFRKMGKLGFLGVNKPVEYGGLGLDYSYAIGRRRGALARELRRHPDGHRRADRHGHAGTRPRGSDEVRANSSRRRSPANTSPAIGVSEVGAGSDVASIKTTARKDGDDYVINGGKMWITNGTQADWICLLANTSRAVRVTSNKSLICVPMKTKGVGRTQAEEGRHELVGHRTDHFDDVRVPQRYRIGEEGMGFIYQMQQFQEERLWAGAGWRKSAYIIQETIDYLREREAFGKPLLTTSTSTTSSPNCRPRSRPWARCSTRRSALYVQGTDVTQLASMCKLKCARVAREVADWCVQFWGGMGYIEETRVNRFWRDSAAGLDRRRRRRGDDGASSPRPWASERAAPR